jgi:hypothetical protein
LCNLLRHIHHTHILSLSFVHPVSHNSAPDSVRGCSAAAGAEPVLLLLSTAARGRN